MSENNQNNENWMNKKWRPLMGYMYMAVCIFDFIIFPILWAVVQFWESSAANDAFRQWNPLTLQGAGLFHMAMGAVLGITAFGRTKEKIEGVSSASTAAPAPQPAPVSSFAPSPVVTQTPMVQPAPVAQPMPTASFAPAAQPMAAPANQFTASGKKIVPQDPDLEI